MSENDIPDGQGVDPEEVAERTADTLAVMPMLGALANTESARVVAQVQASMLLARHYPRDEEGALIKIEDACSRYSLASKGSYVYSRGGQEISGPTIRLAESIVQAWGNMRAGIKEVSRDYENGISVCVAYAVDMQTGTEDEKEFFVRHWREIRGSKGYRVTSDRDIRELVANYGARSKRACIEAIVPKYVFEEALEACERTLHANIRTDEEALKDMLNKFADVGVEQSHIEERINRPLADILPAQMIELHKIFNSLKGGDSLAADWFAVVEAAEESGPKTLDSIIARGERRAASKAPAVTPEDASDPIAVAIIEAKTIDQLNAATVKIGPLKDTKRKGILYALADKHDKRIKGAK